jgi:3-phenylpropionate/trans-cinnamate dioxygenase ferredoxin reductase subunit
MNAGAGLDVAPGMRSYVIVGAGMAGAKAAETLRAEGFDGRVVLLGAEGHRPYQRPPLSKEYLRGERGREVAWVHDDPLFYERAEIDLRRGTEATAIHLNGREVELEGGERVRYDGLLLATGAEPRRLTIPGSGLDGVHYLRTFEDSDALRERIDAGARLVVLGAGWIGAEVAASARQGGCEVTLVESGALPLERVLGPEVAAIYRDVHVEHGVTFLPHTTLDRIEGDGRVERAVTADGRTLECDVVVVGIGVTPRTAIAQGAGLKVDNGIVVDALLAASEAGVFAAGDVANVYNPLFGRLVRVEHWANALEGGPAAARAMLGKGEPYAWVPYFFSDQYDVGMEYAGLADASDEVVFRGDPASREFIAFWIRDERVMAGMNVNVWDVSEAIQALVRGQAPVDRARLVDPDVPVEEIAAATP